MKRKSIKIRLRFTGDLRDPRAALDYDARLSAAQKKFFEQASDKTKCEILKPGLEFWHNISRRS